ncbi:RICIN domain-containing protein [Streptomyces sp. NRRL S-1022]|uniref:RICIN domain-containing protein n=1 Tax=Streptomyces sp. NRRL S-1022 TaxID=1463880 RepID=UPI0004C16C23|nr:hypothetical protein [Streptomyces sp. NRRL S-1022]
MTTVILALPAMVEAPTASAADQPLRADAGYLANLTTGRVADAEGMSTDPGAGVQLWSFKVVPRKVRAGSRRGREPCKSPHRRRMQVPGCA